MTDPKPCGCPDTLPTPMTVAELRALLAEYSGDVTVWVGGAAWQRPRPQRLRVRPGTMFGQPVWRDDWTEDHPEALEGIRL